MEMSKKCVGSILRRQMIEAGPTYAERYECYQAEADELQKEIRSKYDYSLSDLNYKESDRHNRNSSTEQF